MMREMVDGGAAEVRRDLVLRGVGMSYHVIREGFVPPPHGALAGGHGNGCVHERTLCVGRF